MMRQIFVLVTALMLSICIGTGCSDDTVQPEPDFTVETHIIKSSQYLRNRFFRLDLPSQEPQGRATTGEFIAPSSVKVFRRMDPGQFGPDDVQNVAVYVDRTGFHTWNPTDIDFSDPWNYGVRWRQLVDVRLMFDDNGQIEGIDLNESVYDEDILAVVYQVTDPDGNLIAQVGDDPVHVLPTQVVNGEQDLYFRMKLLKAPTRDPVPHVFRYARRNFYSLQRSYIDVATIADLRIEINDPSEMHPEQDESSIPYIRIFGLDSENAVRVPGADGVTDFHKPDLFDLTRGYFQFPAHMPEPFNGVEGQYQANANDPAFSFETSFFLAHHLAPGLYDQTTRPSDFDHWDFFNIVIVYHDPISP